MKGILVDEEFIAWCNVLCMIMMRVLTDILISRGLWMEEMTAITGCGTCNGAMWHCIK
jgi:hypothetical protein